MSEPTRNVPLTAEDVKLLVRGDWLVHTGRWIGPLVQTFDDPPGLSINVRAGPTRDTLMVIGDDTGRYHVSFFAFLARPADPNDPEGWVAHDGGENPPPCGRADYKFSDGAILRDQDTGWIGNEGSDLTHWRPHTPAPADHLYEQP